jgi:hypothetical protein
VSSNAQEGATWLLGYPSIRLRCWQVGLAGTDLARAPAQANATEDLYRQVERDRLSFWAEQANRLSWDTPFTEVLDWSGAPFAKWFIGGTLNVAYNCVDRHVEAGNGGRVAIYW